MTGKSPTSVYSRPSCVGARGVNPYKSRDTAFILTYLTQSYRETWKVFSFWTETQQSLRASYENLVGLLLCPSDKIQSCYRQKRRVRRSKKMCAVIVLRWCLRVKCPSNASSRANRWRGSWYWGNAINTQI